MATTLQSNVVQLREIERLVKDGRRDRLLDQLMRLHPADIADLLDALPSSAAVYAFGCLPVHVASEVLDETSSIIRNHLVEQVEDERLADILEALPMDDAADLLDELPDPVSDHLLGLMEPEEADEVRNLWTFGDESAGRMMTTDVATLRPGWTVATAIDYLHDLDDAETFVYLYTVDEQGRLVGVVPLRALLTANAETCVADVMLPHVVSVPADIDREALAQVMAKYDYAALPVVDGANRLLGVVTVDDVIDVVEEEATEDIQRLGGSEPLDLPYFAVSVSTVFQKRIGWLLLLFAAGALTGMVTRAFENIWGNYLVLAAFVPLIIGTGGNAGSQTIATVIRAITVGEVKFSNIGRTWRREVSVGLLIGLVMGGMGLVLGVILWGVSWDVALVVALTLPAVVLWSTTVGAIVPVVADRIGIDPAVISGPMITTVVDVTGLIIYYSLAGLIL